MIDTNEEYLIDQQQEIVRRHPIFPEKGSIPCLQEPRSTVDPQLENELELGADFPPHLHPGGPVRVSRP